MKGESSHSRDMREKIAKEAIETGNTRAVADRYKIEPALLYGWVKTFRNKEITAKNKSIRDYEKELREKDLEIKILQELLKKTTNVLIKE